MTILTHVSVCCVKHGGMCAWVAVWVYVVCVSCDSLDVYEFVDMCLTHLCAVCCVCQCGVCHFVELWQCGACAGVGVWVCVAALQGEEEGLLSPTQPLSTLLRAHAHAHTHIFGAMAAGGGDGGRGVWRKQNKIKN